MPQEPGAVIEQTGAQPKPLEDVVESIEAVGSKPRIILDQVDELKSNKSKPEQESDRNENLVREKNWQEILGDVKGEISELGKMVDELSKRLLAEAPKVTDRDKVIESMFDKKIGGLLLNFSKDQPAEMKQALENILGFFKNNKAAKVKFGDHYEDIYQIRSTSKDNIYDCSIGRYEGKKYLTDGETDPEERMVLTKYKTHPEGTVDYSNTFYEIFITSNGGITLVVDSESFPEAKNIPGLIEGTNGYPPVPSLEFRGKFADLSPEARELVAKLINETKGNLKELPPDEKMPSILEIMPDYTVPQEPTELPSILKNENEAKLNEAVAEKTTDNLKSNRQKRIDMVLHSHNVGRRRYEKVMGRIDMGDYGDTGGIGVHPELYSDDPLTPEEEENYNKMKQEKEQWRKEDEEKKARNRMIHDARVDDGKF